MAAFFDLSYLLQRLALREGAPRPGPELRLKAALHPNKGSRPL